MDIKDFLENVETVIIDNCYVKRGCYENILKHYRCLRYLVVNNTSDDHNDEQHKLLLQSLLQHLQLQLCDEFDLDNWRVFFQQNSNIRTLTLHFSNYHDASESIKMIMEHGIDIERLFLSFEGYFDFGSICDNLKLTARNLNIWNLILSMLMPRKCSLNMLTNWDRHNR